MDIVATSIVRKLKYIWKLTPFGKVRKRKNALRWGIIGTGYMARTFSYAINGSRDDILYAVASRSIQKACNFSKRVGAKVSYGTYKELFNDTKCDVVYVATPVGEHYENVKAALSAGRNVLCEKPLVLTVAQYDVLKELASKHTCFLMEGMWMKCLPTFRTADRWIAKGYIGSIQCVRVDFYKNDLFSDWESRKGIMSDFGSYAIAFLLHFMPNAKVVNAECVSMKDIDIDWNICCRDETITGFISMSNRFSSLSKAAVIGTKGSIEWNSQFNRTNTISLYDINGHILKQESFKYIAEGFEYEVREVNECIANRSAESQLVSLSSTRKVIEFIESIMSHG